MAGAATAGESQLFELRIREYKPRERSQSRASYRSPGGAANFQANGGRCSMGTESRGLPDRSVSLHARHAEVAGAELEL
jgi:hypothetical protein